MPRRGSGGGVKRNPKTEIRKPKEGRNPKPERYLAGASVSNQVIAASGDADEVPFPEVGTHYWGNDGDTFKEGAPAYGSDLMERTAVFGERIVRFARKIPQNPVNNRLIDQLVGSGTSVGANYCEADDAVSGKEYKLRIGTCRKESKEAMFFLRMIATAEATLAGEARILWREAKELNLIFGAIWRK